MVWVKLDDGFPEHAKMLAVGPLGLAMQVSALCYANRNLTDGFIPTAAAKKLVDLDDIRGVAWKGIVKRLVDVGAWKEVPGGWQIHDYAEYQPTKAQVVDERRAARERMQAVRANKRRTSREQGEGVQANFGVRSGEVRSTRTRPAVPTEQTRARAPTTPPVFNGDAHEARLTADEANPDVAEQHLGDIRRKLNP